MAGGVTLGISTSAFAGAGTPEEPVPLNVVAVDGSYVFSSGFNHGGIGRGDALRSVFDYTRRFPLTGNWFLQAGVSQERFDFGGTDRGPLPSTLQTLNIPLGIVNITQGHIGFLAQFRPGFYFEHELSQGAFDIPFEIGSFWPLIDEKLYLAWGMRATALQHYGVFPTVGAIWVADPKFIVYCVLPEPRVEYTVSERLAVWAGSELLGGNYKMDSDAGERFSGTVVQYFDIRLGTGATITPAKGWSIKVAAGYSIERKFDFYRARQSYVADPAPYVRLQASAEF